MRSLISVIRCRILRTLLYATAALTFCVWIIQSSKYLDIINRTHISLARFFKLASYLSVDILSIILPISLAVSSGFVFHRFIVSRQLTALKSAGIAPIKLLSTLIPISILVTCYLYASNAYISPASWRSFKEMEFQIKNNITPPESSGCIFSGNDFSVYAQKYVGDFSFENLLIVDSRNSQKTYSYFAKSGSISSNVLYLTNGERIEIDSANKRSSVIKFDSYQYDLSEILSNIKGSAQPNERFMNELLYDTEDAKLNAEHIALFHQKMLSPFLAIIFSLMSFAIIVQVPHTRKVSHSRLGILMLSIISYQGIFFWLANASTENIQIVWINYVLAAALILALSMVIFIRNKA